MESEKSSITDYEEVIRVLPESFQNIWRENPDVLVYLSDLGSLSMQRLSQECDRLNEEKDTLLEQTQDLAFHNYKTFIQAANCSHEIFQDFNIIESRLETLVTKLPTFSEKCKDFGKETQKINARWRQASSTLAKHPQLLEFLEMPQLMENCVRNGLYDEALELSSYVKRLERKHKDIPLVKSIVFDVQTALHIMLLQLFEKLRTNIQLPECLKVVGYLRRLDSFNETELRIKFLQARDSWFQKVISNIDNTDAYQHCIKVIENSRIHLFDIITQYRAIFSDDDSFLLIHGNINSDCTVFHSWITWKISQFLTLLEKDLSYDLGGRVDSVLAQCMYFGLSFSRVNVDFRPLLVPIFQRATFLKFKHLLDNATIRFEQSMLEFTITSYTNTMFLMPTSLSEDALQPPNCLLDFYPLAQYCNDVLCAFNELKLSVSHSMLLDIILLVEESLKKVVRKISDIYTFRKVAMNEKENELYVKLCFQLATDLIPHLDKCLLALFPPEDISSILGMTSLEFKKLENICRLNLKEILEPLDQILPSKSEDDLGLILSIDVNSSSTIMSNFTLISNPSVDIQPRNEEVMKPDDLRSTESLIEKTVPEVIKTSIEVKTNENIEEIVSQQEEQVINEASTKETCLDDVENSNGDGILKTSEFIVESSAETCFVDNQNDNAGVLLNKSEFIAEESKDNCSDERNNNSEIIE